jgi:hypothetical protein
MYSEYFSRACAETEGKRYALKLDIEKAFFE